MIEINKVYVDTRQKKGKHNNIDQYFIDNGVEICRTKLDIGDYLLDLKDYSVCVDTKRSWDELGQNLFDAEDKIRFENTLKRALERNMPLIILVESSVELKDWKNPRNTYNSKAIEKKVYILASKYPNVHFFQCASEDTPDILLGFLTDTFVYDDEEEDRIFRQQEEWAAHVKVTQSTQQIKFERFPF